MNTEEAPAIEPLREETERISVTEVLLFVLAYWRRLPLRSGILRSRTAS